MHIKKYKHNLDTLYSLKICSLKSSVCVHIYTIYSRKRRYSSFRIQLALASEIVCLYLNEITMGELAETIQVTQGSLSYPLQVQKHSGPK